MVASGRVTRSRSRPRSRKRTRSRSRTGLLGETSGGGSRPCLPPRGTRASSLRARLRSLEQPGRDEGPAAVRPELLAGLLEGGTRRRVAPDEPDGHPAAVAAGGLGAGDLAAPLER